jgi:hypothetical protein
MRNAIAALVPTLSRFRYLVQVVMLFLSVWGSVVVGHYTAEKISFRRCPAPMPNNMVRTAC